LVVSELFEKQIEDYAIFEQMIREILEEGIKGDSARAERDITTNGAAATKSTEGRIGIKDWWRKSTYAYLNEPAMTSTDENGRRKHAIKYIPQERCMNFFSSIPSQHNTTTFAIF
ncbi:Os04g0560700, partial [Oryza sativa Japonica Group]